MNIKTMLTFIIFLSCCAINAQIEVNEKDSTIQVTPKFKKGLKLAYQVKKIDATLERKNTLFYQFNMEFNEVDKDSLDIYIYLSNVKSDELRFELLENIKTQIKYNPTTGEYNVANRKLLKNSLLNRLEKVEEKYVDEKEVLDELAMARHELTNEKGVLNLIHKNDIKYLLAIYKEKPLFNVHIVDSLPIMNPYGYFAKEVKEYKAFKTDKGYEFNFSEKQVIGDGGKVVAMQIDKASEINSKNSTSNTTTSLDDVDKTTAPPKVDISIEVNAIVGTSKGIIKLFYKRDTYDTPEYLNETIIQYMLIE
ncbi:MAG: hypothetical protein AB8B65_17615 [Kordia sp.]|uniref:hypothetical protein n=1 Tax=Kordia sp. TaxID=1965332 RepID=UPI003858262F